MVGTMGGIGQIPIGVLDSAITVDSKNTNGAWALEKVCSSLTASSGVRVRLLQYPPLNIFVHMQLALHADNEPARDVLRAVLSHASQKLMWSLLYDIDDKTYYLNLIPVIKVNLAPTGQIRY